MSSVRVALMEPGRMADSISMRVLKYGLAIIVGLSVYLVTLQRPYAVALASKAAGGDIPCPWSRLVRLPLSVERFAALQAEARRGLRVEQEDPALGIESIVTPGRRFWIKKRGTMMDGEALLAYVLAEQQWIAESSPAQSVRAGEVVMDVGAHVGTFGDDALRRGAARVVMVEPDPVNVECIRRNFPGEIAAGKVVVIPEGAWSKTDSLKFAIGVANSGTGSLVLREAGDREIVVPVRPLDDILRLAGIERVDFIKMDIEGAEREALKGAAATLARWKPRLMLDMYHRPDDDRVLPRVIAAANPSYRPFCAVCSPSREDGDHRIIPYAVFFE